MNKSLKPYLSQLLTFISVVEAGGFHKAAHKLNLSAPAVSKQIKILEARLEHNLLERNTRRIKLTEMGKKVYELAKALEQQADTLDQFIHTQDQEPEGKLHVLASLFTGYPYILPYLKEFFARYPKIQLTLELAERIPDLNQEDIDLIVGYSLLPGIPDTLKAKRLFQGTHALCASKAYLAEHGMPTTPLELEQHVLINHMLRQPSNVIMFADGSSVYMPPPRLLLNNPEALIQACMDGLGIAILVEEFVQKQLQQEALIKLLPNYPMPTRDVYAFYRPTTFEQLKIRVFLDFLQERIHKLKYG